VARALPEWVGETPDTSIPQRVRLRVWDRYEGRCHRCERKIPTGDAWIIEHLLALILGGENRETNLRLTCSWCKPLKDAEDVAAKSASNKTKAKHLGIKQPKGPPMMGTKASGWKRTFSGQWVKR